MGLEAAAIATIASSVVGAGSAVYGMSQANKSYKKQVSAANSMAAAMEKAPVAQSSKIAEQQTQNIQMSEHSVNADAKRRMGIGSTVNNKHTFNSGMISGRKTLG